MLRRRSSSYQSRMRPGSPVRIIEVKSGYALTSWKIVPGSRVTIAPVTLVQVDDALKLQQGWTIAWAPNS
ncbi:hypothetical protein R3P38DRAFT_1768700 [Favolaschia claudopus]|uniref:Uncharacterized protein n=1 Tax=Favolaschia claudopus TaxID=2862362 RepID=A0AAW0A792_9AGAR